MISAYHRTLRDTKLTEVQDLKRPGVWIHCEKPAEEETEELVKALNLDEGLITDATDFYEVPRFESRDGVAYFYTRYVSGSGDDVSTSPILIAVGPTFVLTIATESVSFLKKYTEGKVKITTTQKTKLFIRFIEDINTRYVEALNTVRREVRKSRRNIHDIHNKDIIRFVALEDTLTDFISALGPTNTALKTFLSGNHIELFEEDVELVKDVQLANEQVVESAKSLENTIINIRSTYATIITNNLNQVIKMLTALTIILTVPTMISSLFGMNVPVPFSNNPLAFSGIVLFTIVVATGIAWLFTRREWI